MNRPTQCAKCGSRDVIADAKVIDRQHHGIQNEMTVATFSKPEALLFKGQVNTSVSAWVCASCGFVELYADNPERIRI